MTTKEIQCDYCGLKGRIDTFHDDREDSLFKHRGHDPFLGHLYYECPSCARVLIVHPMDILRGKVVKGIPLAVERDDGPIRHFFWNLLGRAYQGKHGGA